MKIRQFGNTQLQVSKFASWRLAQVQETERRLGVQGLCCIQQKYTYLYPKPGQNFGVQRVANKKLLDLVFESGIELMAYSPLIGGYYNCGNAQLPLGYQGNEAHLAVLKEVAVETEATGNQLVYAWMLHGNPKVMQQIFIKAMNTAKKFREVGIEAKQADGSPELAAGIVYFRLHFS